MITIALRDMQWRARRLAIGVLATALVFAMTLLLGAVHDSFLDETDRTVALIGADRWVVSEGVAGPFTTNSPMPTNLAERVAATPGVTAVSAVAIFRHVVLGVQPHGYTDVNVIAYEPGSFVRPAPVAGRAPAGPGEAVVDESLGAPVGRTLTIAGHPLLVVGLVHGVTYNGGTPTVLIPLVAGQAIAFDGRPLASALVATGAPKALPAGLVAMTPTEVRDDLRRPLQVATRSLGILSVLLWFVAAGIVGFICYLAGLDRVHDVAVFKAVGVSTWRLAIGLLIMGVTVALVSALVAVVLAVALVPAFPLTISLGLGSCLLLVLVALVIGSLASAAGMLRVVRTDPVLALSRA